MFDRKFYIVMLGVFPILVVCSIFFISDIRNVDGEFFSFVVFNDTRKNIENHKEILALGFALLVFFYEFGFLREVEKLTQKLSILATRSVSVYGVAYRQTNEFLKAVESLPVRYFYILALAVFVDIVFTEFIYLLTLTLMLYGYSVQTIVLLFLNKQYKKIA